MRTILTRRISLLAVFTLTVLFGVIPSAAIGPSGGDAPKTVIHVDGDAVPGGDGSAGAPYDNLADAFAVAGSTSGAVVIQLAPGDYLIDSSLVIERSALELKGSSVLIADGHGWPTGVVLRRTRTRIFGAEELGPEPLVVVGRDDGVVIGDVTIRGLVFVPADGGIGVWLKRVQDYEVRENVFGGTAFLGVESTASSGRIEGNHFSGLATGAFIEGGNATSPSVVSFRGNRSAHNIVGGVLLTATSFGISEHGDALEADVRDNDLSDNAAAAVSFGVRVMLFGPETPLSDAYVRAQVQGNRLVGNKIGVAVDAGFPYRGQDDACDSRVFSGAIDLSLGNNTLRKSQLASALVTFTRGAAALRPEMQLEWQYLHNSTIEISDPTGTLVDAWIDHPESDPVLGSCPGDAVHESLGNTLRYNDTVVENGTNF